MNPDKAAYVTRYGCWGNAAEISDEFSKLRGMGRNTGSVLSYHIIQSFAPNEATAEQVHQAGLMLCDKLFQGKYQYVLTTHTDKDHIHNHIIFCKTNMENYKAFGTLMDTKRNHAWKKIRQLSDAVCKEMGLSVVAYGKIGKGVSHYEWEKQQQGLSWKAKLRLPENIQRRIRQFSSHRKMILDRSKFDNRGLQYWADIQNMKNVAQMINLLESYNVQSLCS